MEGGTPIRAGSVSYTHLDVYKRQPIHEEWLKFLQEFLEVLFFHIVDFNASSRKR